MCVHFPCEQHGNYSRNELLRALEDYRIIVSACRLCKMIVILTLAVQNKSIQYNVMHRCQDEEEIGLWLQGLGISDDILCAVLSCIVLFICICVDLIEQSLRFLLFDKNVRIMNNE